MLVGVIFALAQTDLKRLLAFHTVSQLGYVVTGLALGTSLGVAAGLFYAASHALFKGTLFMCAGAVQQATGTRDMRKLGGLAARMPVHDARLARLRRRDRRGAADQRVRRQMAAVRRGARSQSKLWSSSSPGRSASSPLSPS